jgi:hypothetical protein
MTLVVALLLSGPMPQNALMTTEVACHGVVTLVTCSSVWIYLSGGSLNASTLYMHS